MSFDIRDLRETVDTQGEVVRVVIADLAGSSPRNVGAAMLVWANGQSGTIGGGALEYDAAQAARKMISGPSRRVLTHHALGPDLGQCCGGRVSLLSEVFDKNSLPDMSTDLNVRPVDQTDADMPLAVKRMVAAARGHGALPEPSLIDGWMVEPVSRPTRPVWIWGAGHVGRALVSVLAPLPDLEITWIDTALDRFPDDIPNGVTVVPQRSPADLTRHAPISAEHFILTYSHALDLELCHRLLNRGFAYAGLIGSATKWARFRRRLGQLGHRPEQIARITCPIGDPALGKHPHEIAIGVARDVISRDRHESREKDKRA